MDVLRKRKCCGGIVELNKAQHVVVIFRTNFLIFFFLHRPQTLVNIMPGSHIIEFSMYGEREMF